MAGSKVQAGFTEAQAAQFIHDYAFSRADVGRIGVELEWVVIDVAAPWRRPGVAEILDALGDAANSLPHGGRITFEPGGQLELSTIPAECLADCLTWAESDLAVIRHRLAASGLKLGPYAFDSRPPERVVDHPRYALLEQQYGRLSRSGPAMMCNTASVQVNLDAGDDSAGWRGRDRRWQLINRLGPVLTAMFANSPASPPDRCRSVRQVTRFQTDPTRTDPLALQGDPREEWTRYTLDANVVGMAGPDRSTWTIAPAGLTLRGWLRGTGQRPVSEADVLSHLKTVIPPVRACGHLEVRMIDAQPGHAWMNPVAVVAALLDDRVASDALFEVLAALPVPAHRRDWVRAACRGLSDPVLAALARACMGIALEALPRLGCPERVISRVSRFARGYTFARRSFADRQFSHVAR